MYERETVIIHKWEGRGLGVKRFLWSNDESGAIQGGLCRRRYRDLRPALHTMCFAGFDRQFTDKAVFRKLVLILFESLAGVDDNGAVLFYVR